MVNYFEDKIFKLVNSFNIQCFSGNINESVEVIYMILVWVKEKLVWVKEKLMAQGSMEEVIVWNPLGRSLWKAHQVDLKTVESKF